MSANASHVPAKIGIGALALALATFGLSAGPGSPASAAEVPEAVVAEAAGVLPVVARPAAMGGFASVQVNQWFNCYVEIEGDSSPEFYGGWACGTFVAYDGILYAPRDVPAAMLSRSPFTPITCSSPAPTPPVDSSQLRHCVSLGTTGITLEQVDTWVLGGTAITTRVILHGTPDEGTLIVYRAGDCYVADNDFGTGMVNTARRTASCVSQETGRVQQWETSPLSPHATLAEGYFADLWSWINRQQPFSGQHTTTYHDNAAGLSWQIDLSVYNGAGISSRMIFTPEANATDPDGDGLPDWWEMGCYDADSDGDCQADSGDVMLAEMGADPDVPDVFLEVDWMERPDTRGSFLWFNWGERPISLRPGDGARDTVQEAFWDQGINLHIDAGPDSIMDYRTDRTWGALSDGGPVEYSTEEVVPVDDSGERNWHRFDGLYSRWGAGSPFQVARREVFHYGVAVMTPAIDSSGTWSGIARVSDSFGHRAGDPAFHRGGQFFAFQSYDPDNAIAGMLRDNETALAGTLMHELGHTLGLGHGGGDHDNFKPNHLSIMSYSFQLDGLAWPAGRIDYSDRELAPLDETALDETAGLGVFDGWTGTRWFCPGGRFVQDVPLSGQFNWNCIDGIDAGTVSVDLNGNAVQTVLAGFDDWDHLVFDGGSIGAFGIASEAPPDTTPDMGELSWQKALEIDALGYPGDGDMHVVGPLSFVAGEDGQELYLQVENLSHSPGSWTVRAEGPLLDGPWSAEVPIAGSTPTELASRVVAIPLKEDPPAGEFDIDLALEGKGGVQEELTHRMYVFELDDAQRAILLDQARSGEVEEDPLAVEQLIRVLTRGDSGTNADTTAPTIEFGELTSTSVSGTTEAGASVTVRDASDAVLAGVEAGPDGVFFAGFAEQAAGSAITVEAVDVAGNSSGRIELVIGQPPPSGASSLSPSSSSSAASGSAASKPGGSGLVFTGASVAGAGVVAAALLAFGTVMIARRRTARKTRLAEGDA